MNITVIVPTYNRLDFLKEALGSILNQELKPAEVIVGDDSTNDETESWALSMVDSYPIDLIYERNRPSLGQSANVANLINKSSSEYTLLLHDDDIILENALLDLKNAIDCMPEIDVVFGKQHPMSPGGAILANESNLFNGGFNRTSLYADRALDPIDVTLRQQLPSNSFLVRTELAQAVGYGEEEVAGDAVDFHFSLKLSSAGAKFRFIDRFVSGYRKSPQSVSTSRSYDAGYMSFKLVSEMPDTIGGNAKKEFLTRTSPVAIAQALNTGRFDDAFSIYFSAHHARKIFTLGGARRFMRLSLSVPSMLFLRYLK